MTEPRKASNGQPMTDEFWRDAEDKAEAGLDPSRLRRRVGRPPLGDEPAGLTAVRLPSDIRRALDDAPPKNRRPLVRSFAAPSSSTLQVRSPSGPDRHLLPVVTYGVVLASVASSAAK